MLSIVENYDFVYLPNNPPFEAAFFIDFSAFCCILNVDVNC